MLQRHIRRGNSVVIKITGGKTITWDLDHGPLLLVNLTDTAELCNVAFSGIGRRIRIKSVARGQHGYDGVADSTRSQGGGGGGGGAADLTGVVETIQRADYWLKLGAAVPATSTNGTDGEVQFRRGDASGTLVLDMGSAIRLADHNGNTGQHRGAQGGVARTGSSGKVDGGVGNVGGANQPVGEPGEVTHDSDPGGAVANGAGGGGGGSRSDSPAPTASPGGNGHGQTAGAGGNGGNAGSDPSPSDGTNDAEPGQPGSGDSGGGGGPGGGADLTGHLNGAAGVTTVYLGGGGGGGAGGTAAQGSGGRGGRCGMLISLEL